MTHPESLNSVATNGSPIDLQQREAELRDFVEQAAVAMHWVSGDGIILWANAFEMDLLGYSREEYIGHSIAEFHVDQPVIQDILKRLTNDERLKGCEARLRCKDGSIRHVAIHSSVYRREGKFIHTRCVTLDITEQKAATELKHHLAAIVESSDDAIISKDLNGIIRSWNRGAERLFGYTGDEIIGKHVLTLAAPDRIDEIPNILNRLKQGERIDHYHTKRRTKDGRILTVSLTVSPIRDAWGVVIGASKVARDITERESQEQRLREANEALVRSNTDLQQFAYSASHDLQEPLRMVATYSELLKKEYGGRLGPEADEYLRYTLQGALRMEQLLKDLRAYTLVTTEGQEPTGDLDATAVLERTIANLEGVIRESGAVIVHTALPCIWIHEFQLEQLFLNLIGNAIHYHGSEPPHIEVAAGLLGREWVFSIQDNGIGIDPRYKEQVFEIFKRLHTASEYPGTGMGLAICKRIAARAGGRIWVESELGRGSTFYFTIPIRE
jgi:PAS domain S-box-containing protein